MTSLRSPLWGEPDWTQSPQVSLCQAVLGGHSRSFPLRVFSSYPALGLALEGGGSGTGGRSCEKRGAEHGGQFTVKEAVEVCVETRLKKEVLFLARV